MELLETECLVLGGGPAGATLAGILAGWGRDVVVAEHGRARHAMPAETLLPGSARLIERLGLQAVFAENRFFGTDRHGVIWGPGGLRWLPLGEEQRGLQVDRRRLDVALRDWAAAKGARVVLGAALAEPIGDDPGARVVLRGRQGPVGVGASVVVAALGRSLRPSLVPVVEEQRGPDTAAFALTGECVPGFADATVVEAVPQGWTWWIPRGGQRGSVGVFLDREELNGRGLRDLLAAALGAGAGPARAFQPERLGHAVRATPRLLRSSGSVLLVGDAAATIDPLSSQGLGKALASADAGACAVATILAEPPLRASVLAHHHEWEAGLFAAHAARAADFYRTEGRFADAPFWQRRCAGAEPQEVGAAELPPRLRARADLEQRPVLRRQGRRYVEEPGFSVTPGGRATGRVGPVPVAALLRAVGDGTATADEVLARAAREPDLFPLSRRSVREALLALLQLGFVIPAAAAPDDR